MLGIRITDELRSIFDKTYIENPKFYQETIHRCSNISISESSLSQYQTNHPHRLQRSIDWRILLNALNRNKADDWLNNLKSNRKYYSECLQKYLIDPYKSNQKTNPTDDNPLSNRTGSIWTQYHANQNLLNSIKLDCNRTHNNTDFFSKEEIQQQLSNILFVWSRSNEKISYRQGMNELAALFLFHLHSSSSSVSMDENELLTSLINESFVESDAFTLFSSLMNRLAPFYEHSHSHQSQQLKQTTLSTIHNKKLQGPHLKEEVFDLSSKRRSRNQNPDSEQSYEPPIVSKCNHIFHQLLFQADNDVYNHLNKLDVQPTVFLLRWYRLLFCREFTDFESIARLWTRLFAVESESGRMLELCDHMCVSMIMNVRDDLLIGDSSTCLSILLKYPAVNNVDHLLETAIERMSGMSINPSLSEFKNGSQSLSQRINRTNSKPLLSPNANSPLDDRSTQTAFSIHAQKKQIIVDSSPDASDKPIILATEKLILTSQSPAADVSIPANNEININFTSNSLAPDVSLLKQRVDEMTCVFKIIHESISNLSTDLYKSLQMTNSLYDSIQCSGLVPSAQKSVEELNHLASLLKPFLDLDKQNSSIKLSANVSDVNHNVSLQKDETNDEQYGCSSTTTEEISSDIVRAPIDNIISSFPSSQKSDPLFDFHRIEAESQSTGSKLINSQSISSKLTLTTDVERQQTIDKLFQSVIETTPPKKINKNLLFTPPSPTLTTSDNLNNQNNFLKSTIQPKSRQSHLLSKLLENSWVIIEVARVPKSMHRLSSETIIWVLGRELLVFNTLVNVHQMLDI